MHRCSDAYGWRLAVSASLAAPGEGDGEAHEEGMGARDEPVAVSAPAFFIHPRQCSFVAQNFCVASVVVGRQGS